MKVLFKDRFNNTRFVAEVGTIKQAYDAITEFCEERKFEITCFRTWKHDDKIVVNVGSHFELFYIRERENDELKKAKKWFADETETEVECMIKLNIITEEVILNMYRKYESGFKKYKEMESHE